MLTNFSERRRSQEQNKQHQAHLLPLSTTIPRPTYASSSPPYVASQLPGMPGRLTATSAQTFREPRPHVPSLASTPLENVESIAKPLFACWNFPASSLGRLAIARSTTWLPRRQPHHRAAAPAAASACRRRRWGEQETTTAAAAAAKRAAAPGRAALGGERGAGHGWWADLGRCGLAVAWRSCGFLCVHFCSSHRPPLTSDRWSYVSRSAWARARCDSSRGRDPPWHWCLRGIPARFCCKEEGSDGDRLIQKALSRFGFYRLNHFSVNVFLVFFSVDRNMYIDVLKT